MAYLALARKWRPKVFAEVVGQSHVVQALSNALDSGRVHHAFLFTGTRGVGKTTLARIFAKSLNCDEGTSAEPCQQCDTCVAIDEGRYVDLIEIDAASRTKVDETRELLDGVQYAPTVGKFKVYLIDEVHMLSGHSFNAFLKTLEEPPEHVKFLFATTDPQKLPITVLSRCLQFNLRAMRPEQIENQLVKILNSETIEFDQAALRAISKAADGSMRDGLSLLDQAIAQGGGTVKSNDVDNMLGTIKAEHTSAIIHALASNDVDQIMQVIADMADNAVDFSAAIDDVLMQLYYVSLAQLAPNALTATDIDVQHISDIAGKINQETVQLFYQIGLIAKRDIPLAPTLRVGFEMALLRMLAFDPVDSQPSTASPPEALVMPVAASQSATSEKKTLESVNTTINTPPEPVEQQQTASTNGVQSVVERSSPVSEPVLLPQNTQNTEVKPTSQSVGGLSVVESNAQPIDSAQPTQNQVSIVALTLAGNNEWGELVEQTSLTGLARELAMNCACEKISEDKIILSLSAQSQHLFKDNRITDIEFSVRDVIKRDVVVTIDIRESDKETPAKCLERLGHEQFEQTKKNLQNDPGIQALMSEFGAKINEQSIKSIDPSH